MSAEKLPPITRDANGTIPDYEAHAGVLFAEMVKINDRLERANQILASIPEQKAKVPFDARDLQTMALLLKEGGEPSWEDQIRQMHADFYSGDPARKKPWLDILYDRYDNVDIAAMDPSKPEQARMILESGALAQTFPVKLKENYYYWQARYPTLEAQNVAEQRNVYSLPFETMAQVAVGKAYDGNGNKVAANDPLPDPFAACELGLDSSRSHYYMHTIMTTFTPAADGRFYYPGAQRTAAEYQMHKTQKVQPLRFTLPREFSAFVGKGLADIDPKTIFLDPLSLMAKNYIGKMFIGRNNLDYKSHYSTRVFINGRSAAEIVEEAFPGIKANQRNAILPVVIAMAMASGSDKISTVFAVKHENDVYRACPVPVTSDLTAVYASPQALKEAQQRQAQANSRELTLQEKEAYARGLKEANRGMFDFSAQSKKEELQLLYMIDGSAAKEEEVMKAFDLRIDAQKAQDELFMKNKISQLDLPFYDRNGVAEPLVYRANPDSIPRAYCGRSIDDLTLKNCGTQEECRELAFTLSKFRIDLVCNPLDAVLIDGKSVAAQVRERYPAVTNEDDQERLGNAMLGIALTNGRHRLTTAEKVETGMDGVLQIREKPIHVDVTAMYPTKEEQFGRIRVKYFDWGLFKCPPTKGELAQRRQDELMATSLTGAEEEVKMVALHELNQKIIRDTSQNKVDNYRSAERKKMLEEKAEATEVFQTEKQATIISRLEAWEKLAHAPAEPKKEAQASVEKTLAVAKSMQAKPNKNVGAMPG